MSGAEFEERAATFISSVNSTALLILRQTSPSTDTAQTSAGETDLVKVANGISSEPSDGKKSAAAAIGKFVVDTAPSPTKIIIAEPGTADSWDEMRELVNNNDKLSDAKKKRWHEQIDQFEEQTSSWEEFKASELYEAMKSGKLKPPSVDDLPDAMSDEVARRGSDPLSDFLAAEGRGPLHESIVRQ